MRFLHKVPHKLLKTGPADQVTDYFSHPPPSFLLPLYIFVLILLANHRSVSFNNFPWICSVTNRTRGFNRILRILAKIFQGSKQIINLALEKIFLIFPPPPSYLPIHLHAHILTTFLTGVLISVIPGSEIINTNPQEEAPSKPVKRTSSHFQSYTYIHLHSGLPVLFLPCRMGSASSWKDKHHLFWRSHVFRNVSMALWAIQKFA